MLAFPLIPDRVVNPIHSKARLHPDTAPDDARLQAIRRRDASFDGVFYYGVRTTGVYCQPSCGARPAKRENIVLFDSGAAAIDAGFRACKRCRPELVGTNLHADVVTEVCRQIDEAVRAEQPVPTLDALSKRSGYSAFHLHRLFKRATGVTPRAYGAGARATRLRAMLPATSSVSAALSGAGYQSSSRFYEHSTARLGMTPTRAKRGGAGETIRFAVGETSLGPMLVAATDKGICAIQLGDDANALVHALEERFPQAMLVGDDPHFANTVAIVVAHVEAPCDALPLPLDIRGTTFQERVWAALTAIPAGRTVTYTELAQAIGQPTAVRAVASACAANALAIAIPCHRVIRATGELSGYRWGVERKAQLLQREHRLVSVR
jgi:AraC family transcriptional regulator, regulatory protein of adaptative response / methylated-DNA-[protein]-cysteine methyltransferase